MDPSSQILWYIEMYETKLNNFTKKKKKYIKHFLKIVSFLLKYFNEEHLFKSSEATDIVYFRCSVMLFHVF